MRDLRDAKAMARTLRAALAAKGFKITISQSLELIAELFGVADWNTPAVAIRTEGSASRNNGSPSPPPTSERATGRVLFSRALEVTLHRALAFANERNHEYATLEHLLLALAIEPAASAVIDLAALKERLTNYIDNELKTLVTDGGEDSRPTAGFQRVIQRAVIHVQSSGGEEVTGADVLVAIFAESESPAACFLQEQGMTRYDAANYISHGIVKGSKDVSTGRRRRTRSPIPPEAEEIGKRSVEGVVRQSFSHGRIKPVVVEKIKRRRPPGEGKTAKTTK
jgi:Glyoxalase superfamily protein/Clp amino terminal domain, pathogenicity island component